jgi:hypothetical protein
MVQHGSMIEPVVGIIFYLTIVGVGLASIFAMTVWAGRASAHRGGWVSVAVPLGAFFVAFVGGWLVFDAVAFVRLLGRRLARPRLQR